MNADEQKQHCLSRLWLYQKERFPVAKHGIIIASFSFSAVCLSALLRGVSTWPDVQTAITAFICLLLFFIQLRIADEFKDYENDAKYRPERPVPRGLVSLNELKWLGIIACFLQLLLSGLLFPQLIILLVIVWGYMVMMSLEFGVSQWLTKHPFTYLWTHMLIMPLIDLFATGCDWFRFSPFPPEGLIWFLFVSFFNGIVIEIGRKTWAVEQEREGVESYSTDWGIKTAISVWIAAILLSLICACLVAVKILFFIPVLIALSLLACPLLILGVSFIQNPTVKKSKMLENMSGLWVVGLYLILGIIPMGYSVWMS